MTFSNNLKNLSLILILVLFVGLSAFGFIINQNEIKSLKNENEAIKASINQNSDELKKLLISSVDDLKNQHFPLSLIEGQNIAAPTKAPETTTQPDNPKNNTAMVFNAPEKTTQTPSNPESKTYTWVYQDHINKDLGIANDASKPEVKIGDYLTKLTFTYKDGKLSYKGRVNTTFNQDFKNVSVLIPELRSDVLTIPVKAELTNRVGYFPTCTATISDAPGYKYELIDKTISLNLSEDNLKQLTNSTKNQVYISYTGYYSSEDLDNAKKCNKDLPRPQVGNLAVYGGVLE